MHFVHKVSIAEAHLSGAPRLFLPRHKLLLLSEFFLLFHSISIFNLYRDFDQSGKRKILTKAKIDIWCQTDPVSMSVQCFVHLSKWIPSWMKVRTSRIRRRCRSQRTGVYNEYTCDHPVWGYTSSSTMPAPTGLHAALGILAILVSVDAIPMVCMRVALEKHWTKLELFCFNIRITRNMFCHSFFA